MVLVILLAAIILAILTVTFEASQDYAYLNKYTDWYGWQFGMALVRNIVLISHALPSTIYIAIELVRYGRMLILKNDNTLEYISNY